MADTVSTITATQSAVWDSTTPVDTVLSIETTGYGTILFDLVPTGTFIAGNIYFEGSSDNGVTWHAILATWQVFGIMTNNINFGLAGQVDYLMWVTVVGLTNFRIRLNPVITGSGVETINIRAITAPLALSVLVSQANANNLRVQLSDGLTNSKLASNGALLVETRAPTLATYSAAGINIVPAATPTDVFTLTGSATKTIRLNRILFSGTQTTAGTPTINLVKRSTANTGGTSTAPTRVSRDSTNAAATATFLAYTVNPTLGTLVGNMISKKVSIAAPATASSYNGFDFETNLLAQPIVLRGITEVCAVNLNSVTLTGGSLTCSMVWTEE